MKNFNAEIYKETEKAFTTALQECTPMLSLDALKNINHYLENAELEMAFESLLLSLNQENIDIPHSCKLILYPMGEILGVEHDSVLIGESWGTLSRSIKP